MFQELVKEGNFIEYVKCFDNYYGTLKSEINDILKVKDICALDIEFEGALKVLSGHICDCRTVGILVLPPSVRCLRQRLVNRRSETRESIRKRLDESFSSHHIAAYEYVLINDNLEDSKSQLLKIVAEIRIEAI
jgi:guanylate kinase